MHYSDVSRRIQNAITASRRILAVSHANPDADAVASLISFRLAFSGTDREITLALGSGTVPETLVFLPGREGIRQVDDIQVADYDLLVMLDCADEERVGPQGTTLLRTAIDRMPVINVDHHVTNSRFGTINLVDPEAAATCEILTNLFLDLDVLFTKDLSTTLLSGIQGDTLGLRTPSTTDRTLVASAELLRSGADLDLIVDYLFRIRPYSTLKLWGHALSAATFTGKLVWTEITPEMLSESGADESEAEGIVNFLAGTQGALAAAMLYQKPDGWRVSMRSLSEEVDVSELSSLFGGGGHSRAAGCSLTGDVTARDEFLRTIAERISDHAGSMRARG